MSLGMKMTSSVDRAMYTILRAWISTEAEPLVKGRTKKGDTWKDKEGTAKGTKHRTK